MRTIKHATLSYGLVFVPVGVSSATKDTSLSFNELHVDCGGRVGIKSYCKLCSQIMESEDKVKAYQIAKDQYVTFTPEEMDSVKPNRSGMIEIAKFVPEEELTQQLIEKMYFLTPNESLHQPYELLGATMTRLGVVAIGKTTLWGKEHPCAIASDKGVLILHLLHFADEMISSAEIQPNQDVSEEALALLGKFIELKVGTITSEDLSDESKRETLALITAKTEGAEIHAKDVIPEPQATVDLMATLREMVAVG